MNFISWLKNIVGPKDVNIQNYQAILKQFAKHTKDLKVAQVKELLDEAEQKNCLQSFKTWLLKQNISEGVRTKVEVIYAMQSKKLVKKRGC